MFDKFQKVYRRIILENSMPILNQQKKLLPVTLAYDYTDCDFGGQYFEIIDGKYGVVYNAIIQWVIETLKNQNDTFMLNQFKKYYADKEGNFNNIKDHFNHHIGVLFDINQNKLIAFIDFYKNWYDPKENADDENYDEDGEFIEYNVKNPKIGLAKGFTINSDLIQTFIDVMNDHI